MSVILLDDGSRLRDKDTEFDVEFATVDSNRKITFFKGSESPLDGEVGAVDTSKNGLLMGSHAGELCDADNETRNPSVHGRFFTRSQYLYDDSTNPPKVSLACPSYGRTLQGTLLQNEFLLSIEEGRTIILLGDNSERSTREDLWRSTADTVLNRFVSHEWGDQEDSILHQSWWS